MLKLFFTVDYQEKSWLLTFIMRLFSQLEISSVRSEMLKLVSIGIWSNLSQDKLQSELEKSTDRQKSWAKAEKKFKSAKGETMRKVDLERNFLSHLLKDFVKTASDYSHDKYAVSYCEKVLEFLIDLESQLPTRRFFHVLLLDHNVIPLLHNCAMFKATNHLLIKLLERLDFYIQFQIDDVTGMSLSRQESAALQHEWIGKIQKACFAKYAEELDDIIFASIGSLVNPKSLVNHLEKLAATVLRDFAGIAGVRTTDIINGTLLVPDVLIKCIVYVLQKKPVQLEAINSESLYPEEVLACLK